MEKTIVDRARIALDDMNYIQAFRLIREGADTGDPVALLFLADEYRTGRNVRADEGEADRLIKLAFSRLADAASQGSLDAILRLARYYQHGIYVPEDKARALAFYRRAADAGAIEGFIGQADILSSDAPGTSKNAAEASRLYGEALRLYRKAARTGDNAAKWELFHAHYRGELGLTPSHMEAMSILHELAASPDAEAVRRLGAEYDEGLAVPKDPVEATRLFGKAAELGSVRAMVALADQLRDRSNYQDALRWYRQATDLGNTRAMTSLGEMYEQGLGISQDYDRALSLYHKAADVGYPYAIVRLAAMYKNGRGVLRDDAEAARLCQRAELFLADIGQVVDGAFKAMLNTT